MSGKTPLSDVTSEFLPLKKGRLNSPPFSREGARRAGGFWIEFLFWVGIGVLAIIMYKFVEKDSLIYVIRQTLPAKEAGLLAGMVWGDKSGFSKSFYEQLQTTGLVHLVVASGSNVMLISRAVIETLAFILSRKRAIVMGLGLIWWYAVMVGMDPPIVRAAGLMSIYYGAHILGRKFSLLRAILLVVGLMLLANWQVVTSVSFWLSMMAFIGVITGERLLNKKFTNPLVMTFWQTIWISLWVTPILAYVFWKISLVGPLVNVAVLFLVGAITILGWLGMVIRPVLWLAYPMLHYMVWLVEGVAGFKWAVLEISFNWPLVVGSYLILVYILVKRSPRPSASR